MNGTYTPLAERMRPKELQEVVGQGHLLGTEGVIGKTIRSGHIPSTILWGPPGTGKTTIALLVAKALDKPFKSINAVSGGVKDIREVIDFARSRPGTILFIDEIHRFSKSQQDALLGAVEKGTLTLIGATTENPSFEVNSALLSRCRVYSLKALTDADLLGLAQKALSDDPIVAVKKLEISESAALLRYAGGDARALLNIVEQLAGILPEGGQINDAAVSEAVQKKNVRYDKSGEEHYNVISAFIKSIRGSDPDAAIYWLACMLEGGEEPKFIARRLLILASEDIGNANPTALVLANSCFQAVNVVGLPESDLILSQTVIYMASSAKSNSAYTAIREARKFVAETGALPVPLHLRNAPTSLMKQEGYGKGYRYPHAFPDNFVEQQYLPEGIENTSFYTPQKNAREEEMRKRLAYYWKGKRFGG